MKIPNVLVLAAAAALPSWAHAHADDAAVSQWVKHNAVPLRSVEPRNGLADMQPVAEMVGDARIVALGEATHGTREFFTLKHRMFEFLVEEMGFTIFGIEASYPDCIAINDYVLHGKGDPATALHGQHFWTWDTEEVLDLIEWMRDYNENPERERTLRFYGFDMQNFEPAANIALEELQEHDAAKAAELRDALAPLLRQEGLAGIRALTRADWTTLSDAARLLSDAIAANREAIVAERSEEEYHAIHRHAVVAGQTIRMYQAMAGGIQMNPQEIARAEELAAAMPATAKSLREALELVDPDVADVAREELTTLEEDMAAFTARFIEKPDEAIERWSAFADDLDRRIDLNRELYITASSPERYQQMRSDAATLREFIEIIRKELAHARSQRNWRDIAMAENVAWILQQHPDERIAIWAHNGHIAKGTTIMMGGESLGSELAKRFGDDYIAFGFGFNQGEFQAIRQMSPGEAHDGRPGLRAHRVGIAPRGSVDRVMAHSGIAAFILDMRNAPDENDVAGWFRAAHPMRSIGAVFSESNESMYFAPIALLDNYDCLIFVETTTRARPNRLTREKFGMAEED